MLERMQLPAVAAALVAGGVAWLVGAGGAADLWFALATAIAFVPALVSSVRQLVARRSGVDVIAVLAMAGALLLGEYLAGAIIALMLTGGEALEEHAAGRARRDLTALLGRAPRTAHRLTEGKGLHDIPIDDLEVGDRVVVKGGEVTPADGLLLTPVAVLDESALTGESAPTVRSAGDAVPSGVVNAGGALELRVTAPAAASTYAGIVRLVEQAASERAPFVRMADRYATVFVGITLVLAVGAWAASGDPVRALAVLVVATPCPLILAAPAAIVGGLSHAAKRGIIVKGGGALESLAAGQVVLLDKTGTITTGRPSVARVHPVADLDAAEVLRLAGSLDQVSVHPFAPAIVTSATKAGCELIVPTQVAEQLGAGIVGRVGAVEVRVGTPSFVAPGRPRPAAIRRMRRRAALEGTSTVEVAVDGRLVAGLTLHDPIRPEAPSALRAVRAAGIEHVLLVTGDRIEVAELVADTVGIDRVLAERAPTEKVDAVREAETLGRTIMVGDGINDAPALALADTGIAMGARGASAASQAADVVLTADRLAGVADAIRIAQRTRRIAWQSVVAGMGLSVVAMGFAAVGLLTPVAGALVQEVIDLLVLLNALRAVRGPRDGRPAGPEFVVPAEILADHRDLRGPLEALVQLADRLDDLPPDSAREQLTALQRFLVDDLLPHELEEERTVYPAVRAAYPGEDPTAPMARSHREIARRIRLIERTVDELPDEGPDREDVLDLQRSLWGLHAVLDLHLALEDELYADLRTDAAAPTGPAPPPLDRPTDGPGNRYQRAWT
jgi:heavy metal translocating P-type ATPase